MILKSESKYAHYTILQYNNLIFLGPDHNTLDPGQGKKCSCQLRNFIAIKKSEHFRLPHQRKEADYQHHFLGSVILLFI